MAEKKFNWFRIFESEEEMKNNVPFRRTHAMVVDGKKICLVHGLDGFYVVRDKCPHNGFPLSAGMCSDINSIVCPMHRYHFDLKTGRSHGGIATRVETFPVKIAKNGVFLGVEDFSWWPF